MNSIPTGTPTKKKAAHAVKCDILGLASTSSKESDVEVLFCMSLVAQTAVKRCSDSQLSAPGEPREDKVGSLPTVCRGPVDAQAPASAVVV